MDQKIPYYSPHPSADPVRRSPGVLRLVYRADAQVALGHAKSVRMAIQVTGTEQNSTAKEKVSVTPPRRVAFRKLFIRRFLT